MASKILKELHETAKDMHDDVLHEMAMQPTKTNNAPVAQLNRVPGFEPVCPCYVAFEISGDCGKAFFAHNVKEI